VIIVFVPELEALLAEAPALPQPIARALARAHSRVLDSSAPAAQLLTGRPLAAAAISRLRDAPGQRPDGLWVRADPIQLLPDLNAVWVRTGGRLEPDHPALPELTELFAEEGLVFELPQPERAYLRLDALPDCRFQPPQSLAGLSLDHALPDGPDARRWKRLLNEAQVILHQYRDRSEVGGLWFWGPGQLPPRSELALRVSHVSALDPDLLALADWLGLSHEPVDAPARVADSSLVCWSADPALSADDNLLALADWLRPLWRRLRTGRTDALELAGRERAWRLRPLDAWQFWRRHPGLSA